MGARISHPSAVHITSALWSADCRDGGLMRRLKWIALPVAAGGMLAAGTYSDDDKAPPPTAAEIAGSYRAITLKATRKAVTQDALAAGGTLTIRLDEAGTVTGH